MRGERTRKCRPFRRLLQYLDFKFLQSTPPNPKLGVLENVVCRNQPV